MHFIGKSLKRPLVLDMDICHFQGVPKAPPEFPLIPVTEGICRGEIIGPCPCGYPLKTIFERGIDADEGKTREGFPEQGNFCIPAYSVNKHERGILFPDLGDAEPGNGIHAALCPEAVGSCPEIGIIGF
jgi:hypothetical protein